MNNCPGAPVGGRADQLRDEVDVLEYRAGDVQALGRLVTRWQPRVYSYILTVIGDRDEAWDVSQDLWASVVSTLSGETRIKHFAAWIYGAAHNACASHLRRKRRTRESDAATEERQDERTPGTETFAFGAEDARLVREGLADLSLPLREAMLLFYMDGLSLDETAAVLGVPVGTVQSRLYYGRRKLKETLERKGYKDERR
jgi:RNA polymerase sigma-70 factor (ECF subfamily)